MSASEIIIIGGGFSGLMAAANLVRQTRTPIAITILEPSEEWGLGLAYSTVDASHLLNVRANRMGAWADKPSDFWEWLAGSGRNAGLGEESFAPRMLYASYLRDIRRAMQAQAVEKGITLRHVHEMAVAVRENMGMFAIELTSGDILTASAVLIASGNPEPSPARLLPGLEKLDPDFLLPSAWQAGALQIRMRQLPTHATVFILGAGLTMVDSVLTLVQGGFSGSLHVLSRHGHLPLPHRDDVGAPLVPPPSLQDATKVQEYFRILRNAVADGASRGVDWRQVIDGLRPDTVALWQKLSPKEQRRFFRHLFGVWNIHRHRMAPQVSQTLAELEASGMLSRISGRIAGVSQASGRAIIHYRPRGKQETLSLHADAIMVCAGPGYDFSRGNSPLFQHMLNAGMIRPHASGCGIHCQEEGLFLIGTPLIGERLETTAVPELRVQAAEVAGLILSNLEPAQTLSA